MSTYEVTLDDGSKYQVEVADDADSVLDTLGKSLHLGVAGMQQVLDPLLPDSVVSPVDPNWVHRTRQEIADSTKNNPVLGLLGPLTTALPGLAATAPMGGAAVQLPKWLAPVVGGAMGAATAPAMYKEPSRYQVGANSAAGMVLGALTRGAFNKAVPFALEGAAQGALLPHETLGEQAGASALQGIFSGAFKHAVEGLPELKGHVSNLTNADANLVNTARKLFDAQTKEGVEATLNSINRFNSTSREDVLNDTVHTTASLGIPAFGMERGTSGPLNEARATAAGANPGAFDALLKGNNELYRNYMYRLNDVAQSPTRLKLGTAVRPATLDLQDAATQISDQNYSRARADGDGLMDPTYLKDYIDTQLPLTVHARPAVRAVAPDPENGIVGSPAIKADPGEPTYRMYQDALSRIHSMEQQQIDGQIWPYERLRDELEATKTRQGYEAIPLGNLRARIAEYIDEATSGSYGRANVIHGQNAERVQNAAAMAKLTKMFFGVPERRMDEILKPGTFNRRLLKVDPGDEFGAEDLTPFYSRYVNKLYEDVAMEPRATISQSGANFNPRRGTSELQREFGSSFTSGPVLGSIKALLGHGQNLTDQSLLQLQDPAIYSRVMQELLAGERQPGWLRKVINASIGPASSLSTQTLMGN